MFFCILKIDEERSRIRSWIRIRQLEVRIRIRTKMSWIPNTVTVISKKINNFDARHKILKRL
jgi:hypothetical protein